MGTVTKEQGRAIYAANMARAAEKQRTKTERLARVGGGRAIHDANMVRAEEKARERAAWAPVGAANAEVTAAREAYKVEVTVSWRSEATKAAAARLDAACAAAKLALATYRGRAGQ